MNKETNRKQRRYRTRKEAREHDAGYRNGLRHGGPIPGATDRAAAAMWEDNVTKAAQGVLAKEPLIRAYWNGYTLGMKRIKMKKTTIMPRTERERNGLPPAPCSPVGSRSGVSFDDLARMCRTNRMEYSKLTKDPCYYHTLDCVMKRKKQCGMTCNGVDGERIAADAAEVKSAGWDNDQRDPHGK